MSILNEVEEMKKSDKTPKDWFYITKKMAGKHTEHSVYPNLEDYIQDAMVALEKFSAEKNPLSTIYYSLLNTYNRKYKSRYNDIKISIEDMTEQLQSKNNRMVNKLLVKQFMDWLPTDREQIIFSKVLEGYNFSEIGEQLGYTRAMISLLAKTTINNYKSYIKDKVR